MKRNSLWLGAAIAASFMPSFGSAEALGAALAPANILPRKPVLGVTARPLTDDLQKRLNRSTGLLVSNVISSLTAARMGIRPGDVLVTLNRVPLTSSSGFVAAAAALNTGDRVHIVIVRDGRQLSLTGRAVERPKESYVGAATRYGAVPIAGGLVRDILVLPDKPAAGRPVLFILQGFSCASIDFMDPNDSYRQLTQRMVDRGIGVYRVEKPGVGDSRSPRHCLDMGVNEELQAFRAAYRNLPVAYGIEPDRTFLLGHSLGGLEAPLLASETPPRGVAVYGTVLRNWMDYYLDVIRFQSTEFGGGDPTQAAEASEQLRPLLDELFIGRKSFREIAGEKQDNDRLMRDVLGWDGSVNLLGRNSLFWQELAGLPLVAAWCDTKSYVLALYGESDFVALNDEDHKLIALTVNHYRPGTAKLVQIAGAEHDMTHVGGPDEVREQVRKNGRPPHGMFEPKVADALADWVSASMSAPPVRSMTFN